ncbi:MAG: pantoate--beta-alanine ligase [Bacteroidetes bacterium]|nr:pantoate--beta-alanine ligase [Bacteroidota bacterium]
MNTSNRVLVIRSIDKVTEFLTGIRRTGATIGFVPTMGALHEGHLSIIRQAREETDFVAVSIFVNPVQFNNKKDLEKYPRNLDLDLALLTLTRCDLVFIPDEQEMYPDNKHLKEQLDFDGLDQVLEGKYRPGHFFGVVAVLRKLFSIIQPTHAYFGQKDYQQFLVVKRLIQAEAFSIQLVMHPIIRETDGLAMSSRNALLTPEMRQKAPMIYQILQILRDKAGNTEVKEMKMWVRKCFIGLPRIKLEYVAIVDAETLKPIRNWSDSKRPMVCIAAYFGKVRLIDNVFLFS